MDWPALMLDWEDADWYPKPFEHATVRHYEASMQGGGDGLWQQSPLAGLTARQAW